MATFPSAFSIHCLFMLRFNHKQKKNFLFLLHSTSRISTNTFHLYLKCVGASNETHSQKCSSTRWNSNESWKSVERARASNGTEWHRMEREVCLSRFSCLDSFTLFMCAANEFFIWKRRVLMVCYLRNQNYLLIHGQPGLTVNSMKNNIINDCHLFVFRSSDAFIECQQFVNVIQRIVFARTVQKQCWRLIFFQNVCVYFLVR